jgi:hypothetical protein
MTLFAFRGAKSPAWTFCDHIKIIPEIQAWTNSSADFGYREEQLNMKDAILEKRVQKITVALKTLGAVQVIAGVCIASALLFLVSPEAMELAAEEIMVPVKVVMGTGLFLMFLVVTGGIASVIRVPWGWLFAFLVATVVLVMTLLMGPREIPSVRFAFIGLMALSLVCWADAVVYYYHDLYN